MGALDPLPDALRDWLRRRYSSISGNHSRHQPTRARDWMMRFGGENAGRRTRRASGLPHPIRRRPTWPPTADLGPRLEADEGVPRPLSVTARNAVVQRAARGGHCRVTSGRADTRSRGTRTATCHGARTAPCRARVCHRTRARARTRARHASGRDHSHDPELRGSVAQRHARRCPAVGCGLRPASPDC